MVDWKRKLTSRKFWLAVIGFVTAILIYLNVDGGTIERVTALIMAGGTFIAYIIGEGIADSANAGVDTPEEFLELSTDEDEEVTDEESQDEDI
jgi:hypothetical protein